MGVPILVPTIVLTLVRVRASKLCRAWGKAHVLMEVCAHGQLSGMDATILRCRAYLGMAGIA